MPIRSPTAFRGYTPQIRHRGLLVFDDITLQNQAFLAELPLHRLSAMFGFEMHVMKMGGPGRRAGDVWPS